MQNKLLTLLMIASLANSSQIFSSNNELDTQKQAAIKIQKITRGYLTRKFLLDQDTEIGYASMPSRNVIEHNYIEKPNPETGDTLHARRVICSTRSDLIDYLDDRIILFRNRIPVSHDYCNAEDLLLCLPDLFPHVSAKNYLRLPDDFHGPYNRILTQTEYQTVLAAAVAYSTENRDEDYKTCDIADIQSGPNGKPVFQVDIDNNITQLSR